MPPADFLCFPTTPLIIVIEHFPARQSELTMDRVTPVAHESFFDATWDRHVSLRDWSRAVLPISIQPELYAPSATLITPHSQLDRKPESWKVSSMKTTLDIPEELVREMKIRAAKEGRKLREIATEVIQRGLVPPVKEPAKKHTRVEFPLIKCKHPAPAGQELTPERIDEILLNQEIEWINETSGR